MMRQLQEVRHEAAPQTTTAEKEKISHAKKIF